MTRFFGRTAALGLLLTGIALVSVIAIGLIIAQLIGEQVVIDHISCRLGYSDTCLQKELDEERRKLIDLQDRTMELEALYQRLQELGYASESFVVFYADETGDHKVTTAHQYASLIEPGRLTGGWCYIRLPLSASINNDLYIAEMDGDAAVRPNNLPDESLARAGVTRDEIESYLSRCQWPAGAS